MSPEDIIRATGAAIVEEFTLRPRRESCLPIPAGFTDGPIGAWLRETAGKDQLWRHLSLALEQIDAGRNVVLNTGTASGKTVGFLAPILRELLRQPSAKALILYPQKALGADQLARIRNALAFIGLDPLLVGEINGGVPMAERDEVLERSAVVLMTPDSKHSWLMRKVQSPSTRRFLRALRYLVIDEAHAYDGSFGAGSALLVRRLRTSKALAAAESGSTSHPLQVIAASATIEHPSQHLRQLTGLDFTAITEEDNGAPTHGVTLMHLDGPSHGGSAYSAFAEICLAIAPGVIPNAFIAFADSRQGVEQITRHIGRKDVLPYRGGYERHDRQQILGALHNGELAGVVTTSALELGIDLRQLPVGLNLGLPQTRKALRQRIGRVGRAMPAAFALVAPALEFRQLGGTFREMFEREVEPTRLYLGNRLIQYQAARCLAEELGAEEGAVLPTHVEWPAGFDEVFSAALPGAARPREFDQLASLSGDTPHIAFPLRAIRESSFALRDIRNPQEVIGTIELEKALREAYPGASYHHLRRCYRVREWRSSSYEHSILLQRDDNAEITQPLLSTSVGVSIAQSELIDGNLLSGENGCLAEGIFRITDSVEGYRIGNPTFLYRDLVKANPHMRRRYREFTTTGVLLRVQQPWFAGDGKAASTARQSVAEALAAVLARAHNIAPSDLRTAHARVAMFGASGSKRIDDAIVVFDNVPGGLRLSSALFSDFEGLLDRLATAAALVSDEALLSAETVSALREWHRGLGPGVACPQLTIAASDEHIIFAPNSEVGINIRGTLVERRILEPQFVTVGDSDVLMYRYESEPGTTAWVAHEQVQPLGDNWQRVFWKPSSNEMREIPS